MLVAAILLLGVGSILMARIGRRLGFLPDYTFFLAVLVAGIVHSLTDITAAPWSHFNGFSCDWRNNSTCSEQCWGQELSYTRPHYMGATFGSAFAFSMIEVEHAFFFSFMLWPLCITIWIAHKLRSSFAVGQRRPLLLSAVWSGDSQQPYVLRSWCWWVCFIFLELWAVVPLLLLQPRLLFSGCSIHLALHFYLGANHLWWLVPIVSTPVVYLSVMWTSFTFGGDELHAIYKKFTAGGGLWLYSATLWLLAWGADGPAVLTLSLLMLPIHCWSVHHMALAIYSLPEYTANITMWQRLKKWEFLPPRQRSLLDYWGPAIAEPAAWLVRNRPLHFLCLLVPILLGLWDAYRWRHADADSSWDTALHGGCAGSLAVVMGFIGSLSDYDPEALHVMRNQGIVEEEEEEEEEEKNARELEEKAEEVVVLQPHEFEDEQRLLPARWARPRARGIRLGSLVAAATLPGRVVIDIDSV